MRKRIGIFPILVILGCITVAFLWESSRLDTNISDMGQQYQAACSTINTLETEQNKLKGTLQSVNTDAFIETQARTLYDYMNPDELRLVITNPDVLYGTAGK